MLAAGTAAQASFSTITLGLPAMAPALREEYDLGLQGVGLFIAAEWVGLTLSLLPWGFVTDRIGERRALAIGLGSCGVLVASMGLFDSALAAGFVLMLAAAAGAVPEVCGDAALWFDHDGERRLPTVLARLLEERGLYETLRARGLDRAARYTWRGAAERLLELLPEERSA